MVAVVGLAALAALGRVRQVRVRDVGLALVALTGVLVLEVLPPGLLVLRPVAPLYFGNAPGSGGGCWNWPTRPTRPLGSCCWTWTPSPTSTSPPWTSWPAWTPTCAGVASPCG